MIILSEPDFAQAMIAQVYREIIRPKHDCYHLSTRINALFIKDGKPRTRNDILHGLGMDNTKRNRAKLHNAMSSMMRLKVLVREGKGEFAIWRKA